MRPAVVSHPKWNLCGGEGVDDELRLFAQNAGWEQAEENSRTERTGGQKFKFPPPRRKEWYEAAESNVGVYEMIIFFSNLLQPTLCLIPNNLFSASRHRFLEETRLSRTAHSQRVLQVTAHWRCDIYRYGINVRGFGRENGTGNRTQRSPFTSGSLRRPCTVS